MRAMPDDDPQDVPWYWRSLDFEQLARDYPPPPDYFTGTARLSRDELRALQEKRFLATVARGWQIPFFQRHWRAAGLAPDDICRLDDLVKLPPYDVSHIRESLERNELGQILRVAQEGPAGRVIMQEAGYDDKHRLVRITDPATGTTTLTLDPQTGLIRTITTPDAVRATAIPADSWRDLVGALATTRGGGVSFIETFGFDGQERLARRWKPMASASTTCGRSPSGARMGPGSFAPWPRRTRRSWRLWRRQTASSCGRPTRPLWALVPGSGSSRCLAVKAPETRITEVSSQAALYRIGGFPLAEHK